VTGEDQGNRSALSRTYEHYRTDRRVQARWSGDNRGNQWILAERATAAQAIIARWDPPRSPQIVLDLGCGSARDLPVLPGARVVGTDLLFERLLEGRESSNHGLLACADGAQLPLRSAAVDLVVMFTTLSSVLDPTVRTRISHEVDRVLVRGGAALIYDFRYPNPANRRTTPMTLRSLRALFPTYRSHATTITVIPQLARRLGRATHRAYPVVATLPPLRSHLLALLVKPRG
jgi:SAM-dependent methyltransferase